jgi:hypothetical protein
MRGVPVVDNSMEDTGRDGMAVAARCGAKMKLQVIGAYGALVGGVRSIARARRERSPSAADGVASYGASDWVLSFLACREGGWCAASGVSRKRFAQLRGTSPRERTACMPAMRAHLAVSAGQSRTFCARRVGRRHRCWPETESALGECPS